MAVRWRLSVVLLWPLLFSPPTLADVYRWDTSGVIPGTEGIDPGPAVQLDHLNLEYAELGLSVDLTGANFESSNLTSARLTHAILVDANLSGANLAYTNLEDTRLTNADFSNAVLKGAMLPIVRGLTKEQLYSTSSYQEKNLQRIFLSSYDLTGWDFEGQDLTGAILGRSILSNVKLTGAIIKNVNFGRLRIRPQPGITSEQLYSTASYEQKDLTGIGLRNLRSVRMGFVCPESPRCQPGWREST